MNCSHTQLIYLAILSVSINRHGILRERASVARGRFVSDCGRKCGIPLTQVVEGDFLKDFHIIVLI